MSSEGAATRGPSTPRPPRVGCSSSRRSGPTRCSGSRACAAPSRWRRRVPATVEPASVDEWLPRLLAAPRPGTTTVVYHAIVYEYFTDAVRGAFHETLERAGATATASAPLAWLRFESTPATRGYAATLTSWPGGEERVVATAGAHGSDVRRPAAASGPLQGLGQGRA